MPGHTPGERSKGRRNNSRSAALQRVLLSKSLNPAGKSRTVAAPQQSQAVAARKRRPARA